MVRTVAIIAGSVALGCLAACPTIDLGEDPSNPGVCRPDPAYFRTAIWPEYLAPADPTKSCVIAGGCHRQADGRSALRLDHDPDLLPDGSLDLEENYRVTIRFLNCSSRDASPLLTRPLAGEDSHGGDDIFTTADPQYAVFQGWF